MNDPFDALSWGPDAPPINPDPDFAERLRRRVRAVESREARRPAMSDQLLIPYLCVTDSRAAFDFYAEVFGATQREVFEMDDGRIGHMTMEISGQVLYMADEFPELGVKSPTTLGGNSTSIVINVADADATWAHAVEAGAFGERPVSNQHGARSGWFSDPWGHRWSPTSPEVPGRP